MKPRDNLIYSAVGLAALLLALVAFNYLAAGAAVRLDLTQGKLYISQGEHAMPVPLRSFAQRVEDLAREFKSVAGANLVIEKYNPKPDSDEEDAAQLDGIEPQQLMSGEQFYLGLAVSRLERKQSVPALKPARERLLEYDLARATARVGSAQRPVIGL